jgi:hypothetical protein
MAIFRSCRMCGIIINARTRKWLCCRFCPMTEVPGGGTLSTPPGLYAEVMKALLFFHIRFKTCGGKRTYALRPFQCLVAPSVHAQTLLITSAPTGPLSEIITLFTHFHCNCIVMHYPLFLAHHGSNRPWAPQRRNVSAQPVRPVLYNGYVLYYNCARFSVCR